MRATPGRGGVEWEGDDGNGKATMTDARRRATFIDGDGPHIADSPERIIVALRMRPSMNPAAAAAATTATAATTTATATTIKEITTAKTNDDCIDDDAVNEDVANDHGAEGGGWTRGDSGAMEDVISLTLHLLL